MSQHRGPSGYGLGGAQPYGTGPSEEPNGGALDQVRVYTSKVEDMLDTVAEPVKP